MTTTKFTQLIVALCAVGALAVSIYNGHQINVIHVSINSRMTELLELTQKASKSEGNLEGRTELREEQRKP